MAYSKNLHALYGVYLCPIYISVLSVGFIMKILHDLLSYTVDPQAWDVLKGRVYSLSPFLSEVKTLLPCLFFTKTLQLFRLYSEDHIALYFLH